MTQEHEQQPSWPGGAQVAVSLTFDLDAESGWLALGPEYGRRLSTLSAGRFGVTRGLPRVLGLLAEHDLPATFYVPGWVVDEHPAAVGRIVASGHEVAHHGYAHLRPDECPRALQAEELERGSAAIERLTGARPRGYRSPAWELTPDTLDLLVDAGFAYDSSCMGDDRPYFEVHGGARILELPVHWSLDDWPYYGWTSERGGQMSAPSMWLECWLGELENARCERRHATFTMHPEHIGRGYRFEGLRTFLERICERGGAWFATHAQLAEHVLAEGLAR